MANIGTAFLNGASEVLSELAGNARSVPPATSGVESGPGQALNSAGGSATPSPQPIGVFAIILIPVLIIGAIIGVGWLIVKAFKK